LGIPIIISRLTKIICTSLVEKITARIHVWATRHISYTGRTVLINSVTFGMFTYEASIFLLPNEVVDKITQLCKNFLWNRTEEFKRPPTSRGIALASPKKWEDLV